MALHSDISAHSSRELYEPSIMIATGTSCAAIAHCLVYYCITGP